MTRLMLTLAAWMGLVSVGWASLTPPKKLPPFGKEVSQRPASKLWAQALERVAAREDGMHKQDRLSRCRWPPSPELPLSPCVGASRWWERHLKGEGRER